MEDLCDAVIVGGGPAGLSAAIYLARAKYDVLVLEKDKFGGQITITEEIVNYPGVEKSSGKLLTDAMREQAKNFGARFAQANVIEMDIKEDIKCIRTEDGKEYKTLGIVLAVGASPRTVGFKGEQEFKGRGVAYCATCDGEFFTGREVLVVGGGFAAAEEAMFLTRYASKVTILVREPEFTCAAGIVEHLADFPTIEVRYHTEVTEVGGDGVVSYAKLKNNQTGEESIYRAADGGVFGVFVFVGYAPATQWVKGQIELNEQGYIVTDVNRRTDKAGVYAAGDVCIKNLRQVVTAVSDGAVAATSLEKHVAETREKLHLPKPVQRSDSRSESKNPSVSDNLTHLTHEISSAGDAGSIHAENTGGGGLIDTAMREQLADTFSRFERKVTVAAVLNGKGASKELENFVKELDGVHDKVAVLYEQEETEHPYIDIRTEEGSRGIRYYSVPGGHEFNSFVIALYNAAGPGQQVDDALLARIHALKTPHILQVMTTLSCTNCPDVVMGTQKLAALRGDVQAEMYDIAKFPELKEKYRIMAVPCLVIDGDQVHFGRNGLEQILSLVEKM